MIQQHQSLANARGHSLSKGERRTVLAFLLALQAHDGKGLTEAINQVAKWLGSSDNTIRDVWRHYQEHHTVGEPAVHNRGGASEFHPNHNIHLTPDQRETIQSTLYAAQAKGKHCSSSQLRKKLWDEHQLKVTPQTVRKWLRRLGYRWGKSKSIGKMTMEARAQRVRTFIQQYAEALAKEKGGKYVIVYTDESYCHTGHHSRYGWFPMGRNDVERKTGRGIRLILFHALTKDGLLLKKGHIASDNVSEPAFNAELIFPGLNVDEDYHKSVNGDVFMAWVENRLIPAFKIMYPGKKMILILDNAPYHHSRPEGWKNPNKMLKAEIAAWLVSQEVKELKVVREGRQHTFGLASLFASRSSKYAPTVAEMRTYMKDYLKKHPTLNRTRLKECFDKHEYELVFTPPYTPQTQPIELVWAYVKNYVARNTTIDTNVAVLTELVRKGFYGDPDSDHRGAGAWFAEKVITSCCKWMNKVIENDDDLDGTVEQLSLSKDEEVDIYDDVDEGEEEEQIPDTDEEDSEEESDASDEE